MSDKTYPTLYKMGGTGKIQQWTIRAYINNSGYGVYEVEHGQMGGKLQTTSTEVRSGKNLGKKNETTIWDQTLLEAEALWTKQQQRKGYSLDVPKEKPALPMLAKSYDKDGHKIKWPAYVQYKIDGSACIANTYGELVSRTNKKYKCLPHISSAISELDLKYPLHGELYCHTLTFQNIMSIVRKDDPHPDHEKVEYHVYDCVAPELDFEQRLAYIQSLPIDETSCIKIVPTTLIQSEKELHSHTELYLKNGYEGAMIRNRLGKYKINGRSDDLQKVKKFKDMEFKIVDVLEGRGKFKGLGIFKLQTDAGVEFKATPEGDEATRREYFTNRKNYIGKTGTVKFFEWTTTPEGRVPRFPIFKGVRDYE